MSDTEIRYAILRRIEEYIGDIELTGQELTEDEKTIFESVKNIVNNEFEKASYKKEKGKDSFKLEFELPMEFKKDFEDCASKFKSGIEDLINDKEKFDIDSIISDLQIKTNLKVEIGKIVFSNNSLERKRMEIRKLSKMGLDKQFINMFMKLLEYVAQI